MGGPSALSTALVGGILVNPVDALCGSSILALNPHYVVWCRESEKPFLFPS